MVKRHLLTALLLLGTSAQAAVTVYFSTATTQQDFIAGLENRYVLSISTPLFFPNDRKVTILTVKPVVDPPPTELIELRDLVDKIAQISTDTYKYGCAAGMENQREIELSLMSDYALNCSTPSYFNYTGSNSWRGYVCDTVLKKIWDNLYFLLRQ